MKVFAAVLLIACFAAVALAQGIPESQQGNYTGFFTIKTGLCTDVSNPTVPNPTCTSCCDGTLTFPGSIEAFSSSLVISAPAVDFPPDYCTESNETSNAAFSSTFTNVENAAGNCYTADGAIFIWRPDGSFSFNIANPANEGDCPVFDDDALECFFDDDGTADDIPLIGDFSLIAGTPTPSPAPSPSNEPVPTRSARREFLNDDEDDEGFDKYDDEDDISTRYYLGDFVIYKRRVP